MNQETKVKIKAALGDYVQRMGSANKAAITLNGVSPATISQVLNDNWSDIGDAMWNKLCKQLRVCKKTWHIAETSVYKILYNTFDYAQDDARVMGIVATSGQGKTETAKCYCKKNRQAFHIECAKYLTEQTFLKEVLRAMGLNSEGTTATLLHRIVTRMEAMDSPILILDEWEKLKESVKYFFITFYNKLHRKCAIVLIGTPKMKEMIETGAEANKLGYPEILTRLNNTFIVLPQLTPADVALICQANGVTRQLQITEIANSYQRSIRNVEYQIDALKVKEAA